MMTTDQTHAASAPSKILVIVNHSAGSGQAGKFFTDHRETIDTILGRPTTMDMPSPAELHHLSNALHEAAQTGHPLTVVSIGGDGTNNIVLNEMIRVTESNPNGPPMVFGSIPAGTGRDGARSFSIPPNKLDALHRIKKGNPSRVDIGKITFDGNSVHFLNIASAGISGEIADRVNEVKQRRPWTFYRKTMAVLTKYQRPHVRITVDEDVLHDDKVWAVVVANGGYFGRGMKIAPHANFRDGQFEVVVIKDMPRVFAALALLTVYVGWHIRLPVVKSVRGRVIDVEGKSGMLPFELDGERSGSTRIRFEVLPGRLSMLVGNG